MDKQYLVDQLIDRLRAAAQAALAASEASAIEAKEGATPAEKREDARAAHQADTLGKAQSRRAQKAIGEIDSLTTFRPAQLPARAAISVGAIVEIEDAESGEGRTFFLAPVGAGVTLTGPGGDGFLSVVTPASPVGRAVMGRKVGDVIDVTVEREVREWTITWVG
jgi:transcription elongation GreA/GreB family factor